MSSYLQYFWSSPKKKKKGVRTTNSQVSVNGDASDEETEDTWICQECRKSFTEDSAEVLECQRCKHHFCAKCIKLGKDEYKLLNKRSDIFWLCPPCAVKAVATWNKETTVEECCQSMVDKVSAKLAEMEEKIDARLSHMKEDVKTTATWAETAAKSSNKKEATKYTEVVKQTVVEHDMHKKQQEGREGNLIIHRAKESDDESPEARVAEDKAFFNGLCQDVLEVGELEIKSIVRLGKRDASKTRPLKIVLSNSNDKAKIMMRLRKLKDAEEKYKVSVVHDLSPEERKAVRDKVSEAKEKEKNESEGGQYVFRVRGPPWDLRIVRLPAQTH